MNILKRNKINPASGQGSPDTPLKILFVPRWYPNRTDPMPGLFVKRLAEALAKQHIVQVISVHPDPSVSGTYELVHTVENSVSICRVYYRTAQGPQFVAKLVNLLRYIKAHHLGYTSLMPFSVDIVHGQVLTREIFFAWYMARKQQCPFLISEHWSRYIPENGTYNGRLRKWLTRFLLKRSSGLIVVSESLALAMKAAGLVHPNTFIVHNVVDISVFVPPVSKPVTGKAVILHVSCFDDKSKNISGFLDAVAELYKRRNDFRVCLAGEGPDHLRMRDYAISRGMDEEKVEFTGLKQDSELVGLYQSGSFLVQSSFYETFGTVVIEALACGLPVVSTDTGIASAIINKNNGIIIKHPDVFEFVSAIEQMLDYYPTFEKEKLHESVAGMFSGNIISEKHTGIYHEIINAWQKD